MDSSCITIKSDGERCRKKGKENNKCHIHNKPLPKCQFRFCQALTVKDKLYCKPHIPRCKHYMGPNNPCRRYATIGDYCAIHQSLEQRERSTRNRRARTAEREQQIGLVLNMTSMNLNLEYFTGVLEDMDRTGVQDPILVSQVQDLYRSLEGTDPIPTPTPPRPISKNIPKLEPGIEAKEGEESCAVCFDNVPNTVLDPCGHMKICIPCLHQLDKFICPICRKPIIKAIKVFS